jgi:hypothetical protein
VNEAKELTQKGLNEMLEARIPSVAWHATVAIVIEVNKTLRQFGTGTLLKIADVIFVVTAAHVVRQAKSSDGSLCLASENGVFVPASGEWFCSSEGQHGSHGDPFDVAALEISEETATRLGVTTFLRLHDIGFEDDFGSGVYCLYGFPVLWANASTNSSPVMRATPFQYVSYAFEGNATGLCGYQEKFHLLLSADPSGMTNIEGDPRPFRTKENFPARFPGDLCGISGCSVWRIGDRRVPLGQWNELPPKVVAVETSVYHNNKVIKATKWMAVTTLLAKAFPDLKAAILIWRQN